MAKIEPTKISIVSPEEQAERDRWNARAEKLPPETLPALEYYDSTDPAFASHVRRAIVYHNADPSRAPWTIEIQKLDQTSGKYSGRLDKRPEWLPSVDDIRQKDPAGGVYRLCIQYYDPYQRNRPKSTTASIGRVMTILSAPIEIITEQYGGRATIEQSPAQTVQRDLKTFSAANDLVNMIYAMTAQNVKAQFETMSLHDKIMEKGIMQGIEIGKVQAENDQLRRELAAMREQINNGGGATGGNDNPMNAIVEKLLPVILEKFTGAPQV